MKNIVQEPVGIVPENPDYNVAFINALNWYHANVEKKDARGYLRDYIASSLGKPTAKTFDQIDESEIHTTWCWVARILTNGNKLNSNHIARFEAYVSDVMTRVPVKEVKVEEETVPRLNVRDFTEQKAKEYLGELEHVLDCFIKEDKEFSLLDNLKGKSIPAPYLPFVDTWLKNKAGEFVFVYESTDDLIKEGYSNISKRKLVQLIKLINQWMEELSNYELYKKANRKPRIRKAKPPGKQVAKVKYKKEDPELGIKSVFPAEMVGATQVWVYNTKNRKLAVYRSDSGITVRGTTLQNYDPDQCEQKTLRKPADTLKVLLSAGKIQLRRLISELTTKESTVNGRINEECLIVRVIK